ncbi:MAG: hypothetical protein AAF208_09965 [Cyanobacteria bacterium P01_A01_bin.45]
MEIYNNFISNLDLVGNVIENFPIHWTIVFAQNIQDPDLLGQVQRAFTGFIQSGQAWALLIGIAIGYMVRNLTSYG